MCPRILTVPTRDPVLLRLPWELMGDEAGSLAQRLSVRRQLEKPETTAPRPAQLPLRILYIVSRPADAGFIDPRLTAKALFDATVCVCGWINGSAGKLEPQCETGIRNSRFTVVAGSQTALRSEWVQWEIDKHNELNPEGDRRDDAMLLARLIRAADAEDARRRRGVRSPATQRGRARRALINSFSCALSTCRPCPPTLR